MFWTIVGAILFVSVVIPFVLWIVSLAFEEEPSCGCFLLVVIVVIVAFLIF